MKPAKLWMKKRFDCIELNNTPERQQSRHEGTDILSGRKPGNNFRFDGRNDPAHERGFIVTEAAKRCKAPRRIASTGWQD